MRRTVCSAPLIEARIIATRLCVLLALWGFSASAQELQIKPGDCTSGVHLVARQVPLERILGQLAQALGFELVYEGERGKPIDVDATRPPVELVTSLSPQDSMIVTQGPDPRCKGRNRVVKVWVLPRTKAAVPQGASSAPVAGTVAPPRRSPVSTVKEHVIRPSPELEEQSRRAKAAYDEYVRTHGKAPPGEEEEAARR
jgi:hypothetical protein